MLAYIKRLLKKDILFFQRTLRVHHVLFAVWGGVGLVLFWYGVWELAAHIISPFEALIVSSMMLGFGGLFAQQLVGEHEIETEIHRDDSAIIAEIQELKELLKK